jgi:hypothetical protein
MNKREREIQDEKRMEKLLETIQLMYDLLHKIDNKLKVKDEE